MAGRAQAMETRTRAGTDKEPPYRPRGRRPPTSSQKRRGRGPWLCTTPYQSGRTVSRSTDPCSSSEKITLSGNTPRSSSIGHILSCHHDFPLPLCIPSGEGGHLAWNLFPTPSWCQNLPLCSSAPYLGCIQGASLMPWRPIWALVVFKVRLLVWGFFSI